jgi:hypothetical protein
MTVGQIEVIVVLLTPRHVVEKGQVPIVIRIDVFCLVCHCLT